MLHDELVSVFVECVTESSKSAANVRRRRSPLAPHNRRTLGRRRGILL
jgi:hypothetical protein